MRLALSSTTTAIAAVAAIQLGCIQADTESGDEIVYDNAEAPPTRFDASRVDADPESPDALPEPEEWEVPDVGETGDRPDAGPPDDGDTPDYGDGEFTIGPDDRPARVLVPEDYRGDRRLPVVFLLHSYTMTASSQDAYFGLSEYVDDRDFMLVLPEGTTDSAGQQFWNATDYCCDFEGRDPDDVGYFETLLDELLAETGADPDRVHLFGHSNGGFLAYRLACEYGDRLASLVALGASGHASPSTCQDPPGRLSVLDIHGSHDAVVYYNGVLGAYPGALTITRRWSERNGCSTSRSIDDYISLDGLIWGAETERRSHDKCPESIDVELWTIYGGAHVPGLTSSFPERTLDFALDQTNPDDPADD